MQSISYTGEVPGRPIHDHRDIRRAQLDKQHSFSTFYCQVDHDFINTYQVSIVAGSNLSPADSSEVLSRGGTGVLGMEKNLKVLARYGIL